MDRPGHRTMARRPLFIARQSRRPSGLLGTIIARVMASETANDNAKAIELLDVQRGDQVLDVGTGHGTALALMAARAADGLVTGVDFSDVMLRIASKRNQSLIKRNRVQVLRAVSDRLPFPDASFDRVLAMHTLYFWNSAEPNLAEISRVLRLGGTLVIGFRPAEDDAVVAGFPSEIYRFRTTGEVVSLLEAARLHVERHERRDKRGDTMVWLIARKTDA